MPNEPDYKSAYETLMRAIDQCDRILYRAQIITAVELDLQSGREVEPDVLAHYKALASRS